MDTKIIMFIVLSVLGLLMWREVQGQNDKNDTNSTATTTPRVVMTTELGNNVTDDTSQPITTSGHTVTSQTTAKGPTSSVTQTTSGLVTSSVASSVASSVTSVTVGTTSAGNNTSTTKAPPCPSRKFDAASFFGGILLGLGVCIVSSLVYKWYQSNRRPGAPYQQF